MKNISKILCLLLALVMILPMAIACNKTNDATSTEGSTENENPTETHDPIYDLIGQDPRDLTDEDYVIGYSDYADSMWTPSPINVSKLDASKDTLSKASYDRDRRFEDLTGANLTYQSSNTNPNDFSEGKNSEYTYIQQLDLSGEIQDYDIIMVGARTAGAMMNHKIFTDLNEYDNLIHSDAEYYNRIMNNQLSIGGKQFITAGYYTVNNIKGAQSVSVNNTLLTQVHGTDKMEELYQLALNKQWTFETLLEYDKGFATGKINENPADDKFTLVVSNYGAESLFFNLGGSVIEKDEQDLPVVTLTNTDNINLLTYIQTKTKGNNLVYVAPESSSGSIFNQGQALFQVGMIGALGSANVIGGYDERLMPVPTYQAGDEYSTDLPSWNANVSGIPAKVEDAEMAAYGYELYMALSYQTIYPEYYEKLFALQYVENATESKIFDIIAGSLHIDLTTYYRWWDDYGRTMRPLVTGSAEVASKTKELADALTIEIREFLDNYDLG